MAARALDCPGEGLRATIVLMALLVVGVTGTADADAGAAVEGGNCLVVVPYLGCVGPGGDDVAAVRVSELLKL